MTKRWHDYSDDELLAMTDEEVEVLINIECAHEGLPLKSERPVAPEPVEVKPDVTAYRVRLDALFLDQEQALKLTAFVGQLQRVETKSFKPGGWQGPYYLQPVEDRDPTVSTEQHWSHDYYMQHRALLSKYAEAKAVFDAAERQYNEDVKLRARAVESITSRLEELRQQRRDENAVRRLFNEYLQIAGGDRSMALAFLLKADTRWSVSFIRDTLNMNTEAGTHGDEEAEARGNPADDDGLDF